MEHESQAMTLCEITEQKKRAVEDKVILEDEKRNLANRLEEKSIELARISNMQMDTLTQQLNLHHELNMKHIEISTLKMQNEQLHNELKRERETVESLNKSSEAIKHFEQLLKSPRSAHDTSGLGYSSTEVGESSKSADQRSDKGKDPKPTCHYCNKKGHTANVCRSKKINQQSIPRSKGYCHKCNMQGHMTQNCRSNVTKTQRFDGHCYNCKKYGHRAFECRSKSMWASNQHARRDNYAHLYNWDYNTRQSCHYCQEYGHIPKNCIRTHL